MNPSLPRRVVIEEPQLYTTHEMYRRLTAALLSAVTPLGIFSGMFNGICVIYALTNELCSIGSL